MRKNMKLSLAIVLILCVVCTVVLLWNPAQKKENRTQTSSSGISSPITVSSSSGSGSNSSTTLESSVLPEDSTLPESSAGTVSESSEISDLIPEDQPEDPNLNFETSGSSYDDIMVNVLTCLLTQDTKTLSSYVGSQGLRLSPTGSAVKSDVVLTANELSDFFSLDAQSYGTYPGSGEDIYLTPAEYYEKYLVPTGFDFSTATVTYNDANDLAAASGFGNNPKTVSYKYTPSVMGWKRLIMVYCSEGSGDVLCGIIYQDTTTN